MWKKMVFYKFLCAVFLFVSCTELELCDEKQHPHVVDGFSMQYNWAHLNIVADEWPERLYFVATRILNTRHISYMTNGEGKFWVEMPKEPVENVPQEPPVAETISEQVSAPVSASNIRVNETLAPLKPVTPVPPHMELQSSIKMLGGEYFMMAFTDPRYPLIKVPRTAEDGSVVKDEQGKVIYDEIEDNRIALQGLDEFNKDVAVPVKQITMQHSTVALDDASKEFLNNPDYRWIDLNRGIGYVRNAGRRLFYSHCDYLELSTGKEYLQPFLFASLTQKIDVNFTVQLVADENGAQLKADDIQAIYVEMSGIAPVVSLSSTVLNISELKRTVVKVTEKQVSTITENDKPVINIACKGTMDVLGLVGAVDEYAITGPGICCLIVHVATGNGEIRAIHAKSNLSKQIREAQLTKETGVVNERVKVNDFAALNIETPFRIEGLKPNMGNDGVCGWEVVGEIHVEI